YLDWRLFRVLWHHRLGALAVPYCLSSQRRAIIDLWTDHKFRRPLWYNIRDLSNRYHRAPAVAYAQPRRVFHSADFLCLPAATDASRDACCRQRRDLVSQRIADIAFDLHRPNLPNAFSRARRGRCQRVAARSIDGRHHSRRMGFAILGYQRSVCDVWVIRADGDGRYVFLRRRNASKSSRAGIACLVERSPTTLACNDAIAARLQNQRNRVQVSCSFDVSFDPKRT